MTLGMSNAADLTAAIVAQHSHMAHLAMPTHADVNASPLNDSVHDIAYAAARHLGFIDADAKCIAQAWQRQSERTGQFDPTAWPCEAQDFGVPPAPRNNAFPPCPHALGFYAVLPSAEWVGRMARAGVPTVQLRFKSPDPAAVRAEIQAAVAAVQGTGSLLFINDHWREAIAAGAYGVHLGQEDLDTLSTSELAEMRHAGLRLGLSTHGYAEMLRADAVGPSYIALGAVFPTTLKAMATPPQGLGRLHAYARLLHDRALVAIGGIGMEQLPDVAASGAGSFAVVRALVTAPDPEGSAQALMQRWAELKHGAKAPA